MNKNRILTIILTFGSVYALIFTFFMFTAYINNDISMSRAIMSAQIALLLTAFAGCAGAIGVWCKEDSTLKMEEKNETT